MKKLTTAIITARLGGPPEAWTFVGQCFDAGEQGDLTCAIMQTPSRYLFALKPADGAPGCRYISYEAIPLFKLRNPELYRRLLVGVAFLEIRSDGYDRQEKRRKERGNGLGSKGFESRGCKALNWQD